MKSIPCGEVHAGTAQAQTGREIGLWGKRTRGAPKVNTTIYTTEE